MLTKTISTREWATVKRIAQSVQPMLSKQETLKSKMKVLAEEYKTIQAQIEGFEYGIKALCQGLSSSDLVKRVCTPIEGKFDKEGKQLKKTTYEPTDRVHYDSTNNVYIVEFPEENNQTQEEVSND